MIKILSILCGMACASCTVLPAAQSFAEKRYGLDYQGAQSAGTSTVTVSYQHSKKEDDCVVPYGVPTFKASNDNSCVVTAGGNALVYYDITYPDLIDGYTPAVIGNTALYGSQNTAVNNMFDELATKMGQNADGVTVNGFTSGLKSYLADRNHSSAILKATGGYHHINYEAIFAQLKQGRLITIFCTNFALIGDNGFKENANSDTITYSKYNGAHAMLVYGYKDIKYYDKENAVSSRHTFLYVSTGISGQATGMVYLGAYGYVDDAYILFVL